MIKTNDKYSWDSEKRDLTVQKHGLDFVLFADAVFADPNSRLKKIPAWNIKKRAGWHMPWWAEFGCVYALPRATTRYT